MSWDRIRNFVAREVQRFLAVTVAEPRFGMLTGYDEATHTAKHIVLPEGAFPDQGDVIESNWTAIVTLSGGGSGVYVGRAPKDQIFLVHQEHAHGLPVNVGRVHTQADPPPAVPSAEIWFIHASGSFMKMTADGKVMARDASGTSLQFQNNGTATLTGTLHVTGGIIGGYGSGDQVGLQTHTHNQGSDSHGDSESPTNPPNAGT